MGKPVKHYGGWRIRWFDERGKRRSDTHATHDDARRALARHEAEVEAIRRGERRRLVEGKSFADLATYWLETRAVEKRSRKDDESMLRRHLLAAFGPMKLRAIGVEDVDRYVSTRRTLDPKTVNNHLTLLRTMLNVAVDLGWLHMVPRFKKPRVRLFSEDFAYLRTSDEILRFLRLAREREGEMVFALFATAVFTGMRAGELAGLRWPDVDFDTRIVTVQRSFDGPTKSGDVRYVPLVDALLPVLRAWRLRHPGEVVFTNRDGRPLQPSGRVFQEVFHRVLDAAGFKPRTVKGKQRPHIRFHDLRHTFASHWMANGGELFTLQKVLGHKSTQMTMRYAHLAPTAFAKDFGRFGAGVDVMTAEVVPIQPASCTASTDRVQETKPASARRLAPLVADDGPKGAQDGTGDLLEAVDLRRGRA